MKAPRQLLLVLAVSVASMGASHRTTNFVVEASNAQVAQQVGQYAEKYRKEKALEWLGYEMPAWPQPCPLRVIVTPGGAGGATTFDFGGGTIRSQHMEVQGSLERILASVLPHEITHTVFAHHFRCPLPRWADEGGCVLSEDDVERRRHDDMVRQLLAGGKAFRLRVLFPMKNYPPGEDVMTLYAQGYSMARFLVESTDRRAYLAFVGEGMRSGWDRAVQVHFQMNKLEELEEAWLNWMRGVYSNGNGLLVKNARSNDPRTPPSVTQPRPQPPSVVRPTEQPVIRAAGPDEEPAYRSQPAVRPRSTSDGWTPLNSHAPSAPRTNSAPGAAPHPFWQPPRQ
jgi:hypothetical protein